MPRPNRTTALDLWPESDHEEEISSNNHEEEQSAPSEEPDVERIDAVPRIPRKINRDGDKRTYTTHLVAHLASEYFDNIEVVENVPEVYVNVDSAERSRRLLRDKDYIQFIQSLMDKYREPARVTFDRRLAGRRIARRQVTVGTNVYNVGDVIITAAGDDGISPAPPMPKKAEPISILTVGTYFWLVNLEAQTRSRALSLFGIVLSLREDDHTAHVQWLHHGCKTVLETLAHPQELFLTTRCNNIPINSIISRAKCQRTEPGARPSGLEADGFFYGLRYDETTAAFLDIDTEDVVETSYRTVDECPLCLRAEKRNNITSRRRATCDSRTTFELNDTQVHIYDFVMFIAEGDPHKPGPCSMGQVVSIGESHRQRRFRTVETTVTVRLLGRLVDVVDAEQLGVNQEFHDRALYLRDDCVRVKLPELIEKCFVLPEESILDLQTWLNASTRHFFASKKSSYHGNATLHTLSHLPSHDLLLCRECMLDKSREMEELEQFKKKFSLLRIFDPFAGVGGFVQGLVDAGVARFTHGIDICPSTTKTLRNNYPDTTVYNQCSNDVLNCALTRAMGDGMALKSLDLLPTRLANPPAPGEIDFLVSGFPCQPHSALNMYKKADDKKSHLILTVLSWVDHLKPKFCLFENVQGFLDYKLNSEQVGPYTVRGGIDRGGVKLLVRSLTALGYQVRFALLEAGHYGTPQGRVRFFLWAAKSDYPLPEFPRPTHNFPCRTSMPIKFPTGITVSPIDCREGIYPIPFVTVKDAISDLKRWHWRNPHKIYEQTIRDREAEERERAESTVIRNVEGGKWCGIEGRSTAYEHPPRTAFQVRCRRGEVQDIQHYTQCFKDDIVERVVNIDLVPNANFLNLTKKPKLLEWLIADQLSANAREGYRSNYYGRLDENGYFQTTVTEVRPTAKQGKILNPWCKRILTVRELARSQGFPDHFKFYTIDNDVVNMHEQIGNAVPLPLAEALGRELFQALFKKWRRRNRMAPMPMDVDDD